MDRDEENGTLNFETSRFVSICLIQCAQETEIAAYKDETNSSD